MTTRDDPKMVQTPYGMRQEPGASKAAQPIPDLSARRTFNPLDAGFSLVADPDEPAEAAHPAEGVYSLGPWMASGVRQRLLDERQQYLVVVRAYGGGVAYTPYSDLTAAEHRESHADQRLIAAAPTMAAEIERLHAIIHGMQDGALIRDQAALIERLRAQSLEDQDARRTFAAAIGCPVGHNVYEFARAEKAEMLAALRDMQFHFGNPKRDEWLTKASWEAARDADQRAKAVIDRAEGRQP